MLVATCTYHEGNDEFHAILQLAKPTDLDSSGNYNTLTAVAAPYDVNVIEEIQRSWGIFGYPIAFNITEFPGSEFRSFLFTEDSVIQELDTPVDLFNGISGASSYTCIQNIMNYSNEGFFMIFTESEYLGNNAKLFAQDIATLNDTTVYSVGATFIATKKFTCTRCGYVAQGAVAPASCPVCKGTDFITT